VAKFGGGYSPNEIHSILIAPSYSSGLASGAISLIYMFALFRTIIGG
jgi:hypothetical protein